MTNRLEKLKAEIRALPDIDKVRLVDAILADLDKPDPEIEDGGNGDKSHLAVDHPKTGKVAIKVINHYGDEVLKVYQGGEKGDKSNFH